MTTNPQHMRHSKFSLQEELKRRKAAELQSEIELRRIIKATQQDDPRRTTQTAPRVQAEQPRLSADVTIARKSRLTGSRPRAKLIAVPLPALDDIVPVRRTLTRQQKQKLIGLAATLLIVLVIISMALLGSQSTTTQAAPLQPLPLVSANDMVAHFKRVGLPISSAETITDEKFTAHTGVRFKILRGNDRGQFIVLSYATVEKAQGAAFRFFVDETYKRWKQITASNILILVAPDTTPSLQQEISSHVTQFLVAPYRSFLPTATATLPETGD